MPPHLFWIYVVKILKFRKTYFFHFFVPPHKKFASAHPEAKNYMKMFEDYEAKNYVKMFEDDNKLVNLEIDFLAFWS